MLSTSSNAGQCTEAPAGIQDAPLIHLNRVRKTYPGPSGPVEALKDVDLHIHRGEFLVINGRSGSGKTTLVNVLTGLDHLTAGEIWVEDTPLHQMSEEEATRWRGQNVGVVFQSFHLMPTLSALQNVTLPMDFAGRGTLRQRQERGAELLAQVGLEEHLHKRPGQVSGGQQQRIAIARALANDPPIIIADEPTGSLDSNTAREVFAIFATLARQGKTVLVVTHDDDLAHQADRLITLKDGQIQTADR